MTHDHDRRQSVTDPLPCGCEPYQPYRCQEALELWNEHARAHKQLRETTERWARGRATHDQVNAARRNADEAWQAYCDHLGEEYVTETLDTIRIVAIERELPRVKPTYTDTVAYERRRRETLADFRAEEKRKERAMDAAEEVAYMRESGGWD